MAQPQYNMQQQIYCWNFMSNAGFGLMAPNYQALVTDITGLINKIRTDTAVTALIGTDWDPIWGPCVYSKNPTAANVVSDNTMMMVYSPSQATIVIAIAGTNPDSVFDWSSEDFAVSTMVSWSSVVGTNNVPANAYISTGTDTGLQILLGMPANTGATGSPDLITALSNFLALESTPSGLTLAVTGHSLGGALSPTMAAYLNDILQNGNNWNSTNKVTGKIQAWPTAGPTPGEQNFASHLETSLAYTSQYNIVDAVPHAWGKIDLALIPFLYGFNLPNSPDVDALVLYLENQANQAPYPYVQANRTSLPGTFSATVDAAAQTEFETWVNKFPALQTYETLFRYLCQVGYQHTSAYPPDNMLNVAAYSAASKADRDAMFPSQTLEQVIIQAIVNIIIKYITNKTASGTSTPA